MVYCLPLMAGGEEVGVVQLGYAGRRPSPPTAYLPILLNLAERAAQAIKLAWMVLPNQRLAQSRLTAPTDEPRAEVAQKEGPRQRRSREDHSPDTGSVRSFLEIRCLGGFELYRQGKLVTSEMFQRRGALTLLKILLIHGGRPVPRDVLAEYLWPEAGSQGAANRLHVLVHALRRVVEPSREGRHWVFICSDGDRYYFNPEAPYLLDVEEFRESVMLGQRLERAADVTPAIDAYEAAVKLYRGDLLEEEPYAEWCWGEREHLKEVCLSVLGRLATVYLERDAPAKSIMAYRQALRIDPLREENHRGLMGALLVAGQHDEALRAYRVCSDILHRELEVEPLPETEQLYSLIRNNGGP